MAQDRDWEARRDEAQITAGEVAAWGESSQRWVFKIESSIIGLQIICVAKDIKSPKPSLISVTCTNATCEELGGESRKGMGIQLHSRVSMEPGAKE